jgi:hypothetical protein
MLYWVGAESGPSRRRAMAKSKCCGADIETTNDGKKKCSECGGTNNV